MGDAHKVEMAQFPQGVVLADKPTQFMVRKNGAVGALDAKVSYLLKIVHSSSRAMSIAKAKSRNVLKAGVKIIVEG